MKRSQINRAIQDALQMMDAFHFHLPPFARWSPEDYRSKGPEYDEIHDNMLGWDITDYGSGDYEKVGLLLFTIRNGNYHLDKYVKPYAEKVLIVGEGQVTPYHFHWKKMEDIINRGGGDLMVKVYNSTDEGGKGEDPVTVSVDGRTYAVPAGSVIRLTPGESITLPCGQYHKFWGEGGKVLVGEVSKVNDDRIDNRFFDEVGRFPTIQEDEPIRYPLFSEAPRG
ncbi:MAG: D-lyxose/D-mannose family sugar isomerase [Christensenellales bacterium]|jgi:D-lyxose ketol-isomerase